MLTARLCTNARHDDQYLVRILQLNFCCQHILKLRKKQMIKQIKRGKYFIFLLINNVFFQKLNLLIKKQESSHKLCLSYG